MLRGVTARAAGCHCTRYGVSLRALGLSSGLGWETRICSRLSAVYVNLRVNLRLFLRSDPAQRGSLTLALRGRVLWALHWKPGFPAVTSLVSEGALRWVGASQVVLSLRSTSRWTVHRVSCSGCVTVLVGFPVGRRAGWSTAGTREASVGFEGTQAP